MLKQTTGWITVLITVILLSAGYMPVRAQEEEEVEIAEEIIGIIEEIPYYSTEVSDELIKDRLQCLQNKIQLSYNPQIRSFIDYFSKRNRNYLTIMEQRKNIYFPIFEEYLKKHDMPDELKYLSIVESGLNPKAISRAGAAGLWQFMPSTGKIYHLRQDTYIDERLDPYLATEAACKYLKQLYNIFNDWELALASYNCGPGNVRKAIRKSGYKESFWGIYNHLPKETRGYVPQFVAIMYVMNHLDDYGFEKVLPEYAMEFDTVRISQTINIDMLCQYLGICRDDVNKLNPGLRQELIPGYLNYSLRLPADVMATLHANRTAILDSCLVPEVAKIAYEESIQPAKIVYTVKKGDYLGKIAEKHRVSVNDIRQWNKLKQNTVYVGQKIVIHTKQPVSAPKAAVAQTTSVPAGKTGGSSAPTTRSSTSTAKSQSDSGSLKIYHEVKSGDNLHRIAERYDVSVSDIREWNKLSSTVINVGQKLVINSSTEPGRQHQEKSNAVPKVYQVQPGDTLWSISRKYEGLTVEEIKKKNNLKDENIKPGMKLILG